MKVFAVISFVAGGGEEIMVFLTLYLGKCEHSRIKTKSGQGQKPAYILFSVLLVQLFALLTTSKKELRKKI